MNTIFLLLTLIGVVKDPTTDGLSDSDQAMPYRKLKNMFWLENR
ncbi:phage holin [Enterococcus faecalis]|nr:phage holin [Enterococcus faecalis]MBE8876324.1 hypothetical protein [Enterococcus faecalis]MCU9785833.1 phage holin family protein [Enterococcus faecalis]MCU9786910.1 phage holin family protein [Enterococcus faecalis]MDF4232331.1 phage holin [Enterococcus faecalis]